ncbi:MAG: hypothetical protein DRP74_01870 [Candidatus Omnitrophota bacterium]|nr:MAG: hypothetical protein DRP74_01870 [Candidatus Omnitrophota bacterium]
MKVLLVNPPYLESVYSGFKPAVQVQLPLGLAYIGSIIAQEGLSIEVLDANAEGMDINSTVDNIVASDADVVGFTTTTLMVPTIIKIIEKVGQQSNKKIILGGPHVTFFPEQMLKECPQADIIVMGEGEETVRELIRKNFNDLQSIEGIAFRRGSEILVNKKRQRIKDLNILPYPNRDLFKLDLYSPGALWNIGCRGKKSMTIITSRGCPSRCRYCSSLHFWGPDVRFRSIDNIIEEVENLKTRYKIKQLAILDDTFLANKKRVESFCDEVVRRKIKIKWWCYARLDFPYPAQLFKKMRRAGCYGLNFGVESGNQKILNGIGKNIKLGMVESIINLAKKEGFLILASFMIGLPGDTRETTEQTIDFAIRLNPHIAQFCITTPFPGTDLYEEALRKGWLKDVRCWDDMGLHQETKFRNDDLTSEEIYQLYKLAHKKFYFRVGYFWLIFKHLVKNPAQITGFFLAGIYMITEIFRSKENAH